MMKRQIILTLVIIFIGVIVMTGYDNLESLEYVQYFPKDELIDLTFEYPKGWEIFERRGEYGSFIQAQILESPKAADKERVCSIIVTIYPKSQAKFTPLSAQGLADDIKNKRLSLKGSQLLSSSNTSIAGLEAIDLKLSYETYKIPLQANDKPVPIIERIVCFQNGDNFYTMRLEEMEESFEGYNTIFNRALKTIQLSH
jgi:hypothetical protein